MRGVGGSTADREPSASLVDEQVVDEHCRYIPAEPLRRYVAWYTGYRQRGLPPATHRGLPSPYLTLIFTLDDPLEVAAHPDPRQPPGRYDALIGGLHLTPAQRAAVADWCAAHWPDAAASAATATERAWS